jgi:hypothetical protein
MAQSIFALLNSTCGQVPLASTHIAKFPDKVAPPKIRKIHTVEPRTAPLTAVLTLILPHSDKM